MALEQIKATLEKTFTGDKHRKSNSMGMALEQIDSTPRREHEETKSTTVL